MIAFASLASLVINASINALLISLVSIARKLARVLTAQHVTKLQETVTVLLDGLEMIAASVNAQTTSSAQIAQKLVNAKLIVPNYVILMMGNVTANQDGAAQRATDRAHFLNTENLVPFNVTAKIMLNARRLTEHAFVHRVLLVPSVRITAHLAPTGRIALNDANARTTLNVTQKLVSVSANKAGLDLSVKGLVRCIHTAKDAQRPVTVLTEVVVIL